MKVTRKVLFLPAAPDGCALARMLLPHLRYPRSGYYQCDEKNRKGSLSMVREYYAVLTQRQMRDVNLEGQDIIQKAGIKYVLDLDDNFWHVPKYNPGYVFFRRNPEKILRGLETCLRKADWITVSTPFLAKVVERKTGRKDRVTVVENALDPVLYSRARRLREDGVVTVGWAGTNTHSLDVAQALEALWTVMRKYPNVRFETMGWTYLPQEVVKELGEGRFRHWPWVDIHRYPPYLSSMDWDITLAPLLVTDFNKAKCLSAETSIYGLLDGVPVRRSLGFFLKSPCSDKCLPGPDGTWRKVLGWEKMPETPGYSVRTRSGDFYHVTDNHRFRLLGGKLVEAQDLRVGDVIDEVTARDLPNIVRPLEAGRVADYEMGWFVGYYLGDGTMTWEEGPRGGAANIQLHLDVRRTDLIKRLRRIAERWGVSSWKPGRPFQAWGVRLGEGHATAFSMTSHALKGFLQQYVAGVNCYTKHLLMPAWSQGLDFLRGIVDGWLDADGSKEKGTAKHTWSFGITQNWQLLRDMQLVCLLVGYRLRYRRGFSRETKTDKIFKVITGTVRKTLQHYQSVRPNGEVMSLVKQMVSTVAVEVDGDHLFVLPSGLVMHNSSIKMMESGALGIPCLASSTDEYLRFCGEDGILAENLLCGPLDKDDWVAKLERLVTDRPFRWELGRRMHRRFLEAYDIRKRVLEWMTVFEAL